jgi:cell division septum initiation protein DivIVA
MSHYASEPTEPLGAEVPEGTHPLFERVARGYHMQQVDDYVRDLLERLHSVEQHLAGPVERAASEAMRSPQARQAIDELMRLALDEILGNKAAAEAEAAQLLETAREEAAKVLSGTRTEVDEMVSGAREQSGSLLSDARGQARKMLDDAAALVDEAQHRVEALASVHRQTLTRLNEISQVTGRVLSTETERGPVQPDRALHAAAPAQLTAAAEVNAEEQAAPLAQAACPSPSSGFDPIFHRP